MLMAMHYDGDGDGDGLDSANYLEQPQKSEALEFFQCGCQCIGSEAPEALYLIRAYNLFAFFYLFYI